MEDKKLDLNSIIGFVLIFGILIWMMYQNQPSKEQVAAEKAKNPGVFASLTGSAEQAAIDAFSAQKRLQAMKKEIETIIMYQHGPKGLEEYKDTLRKIRAQRKKTAYRKAEIKEAIIMWVVGGIIVMAGIAGLGAVLYLIGKQQGKW